MSRWEGDGVGHRPGGGGPKWPKNMNTGVGVLTAQREMGPMSGGGEGHEAATLTREEAGRGPALPAPSLRCANKHTPAPEEPWGGCKSQKAAAHGVLPTQTLRAGPSLGAGGFQGLCPHWPQMLRCHITQRAWGSVTAVEEPAFLLRHLSPLDDTPPVALGRDLGEGWREHLLSARGVSRPADDHGLPPAPQRTSQVTALSVELAEGSASDKLCSETQVCPGSLGGLQTRLQQPLTRHEEPRWVRVQGTRPPLPAPALLLVVSTMLLQLKEASGGKEDKPATPPPSLQN